MQSVSLKRLLLWVPVVGKGEISEFFVSIVSCTCTTTVLLLGNLVSVMRLLPKICAKQIRNVYRFIMIVIL